MHSEQDFFAVLPEQRTIYQENVCRPGWLQPMPELAADPLYIPGEPVCSCSPDEICETCWRERRDAWEELENRTVDHVNLTELLW